MAIINTINPIVSGTTADDQIFSIVDPFIAGSGVNQTLFGGLGGDTYILGNTAGGVAGDTVVELFGEGIDTVVLYTNITGAYTLVNNVENLISRRFTPGGGPGSAAATLNGNQLNNLITVDDGNLGGAGASETLDGGIGNDTMSAGHGNDNYNVDSALDVIIESNSANLGGILVNGFVNGVVLTGFIDNVNATVSYTLGANVENLTLLGTPPNLHFNGTGNLLPNALTGNAGNNVLSALEGNDTILGGGGNDTLLGGGGNDLLDGTTGGTNAKMDGGAGNDTYRMDSSTNDAITGDAGGVDTVQLTNSATFNTYVLPAFIENVIALAAPAVTFTGNALDNQLFGNAGADTLIGGDGNDILDGGGGIDSLSGGKGNDVYLLDQIGDIVAPENLNEGIDSVFVTLLANATYTLGNNFERLTLTGAANANGTGNALDNAILGNSGNNTLIGLAGNDNINGLGGNDMLAGGLGNDTLDGDAGNDSISGAAGNDLLFGGAGTDTLEGGDGTDTLDGGAGADSMSGGAGGDIYFVDANALLARDIVFELPGVAGGFDVVNSSVSISQLFANVENLTLTGTANIDGTGNALSNIITGNIGDNLLDAGKDALADTLIGGLGNDTFIIYSPLDVVTEVPNLLVPAPGSGLQPGFYDTVIYRGSAAYTLAANVEQLLLDVGLGDVNANGNLLDNMIFGSSGANSLDGGAGNDNVFGGDGNDTLSGGLGNDSLDGNLGADWMIGGGGDDTYIVENGSDIVDELSGGSGNDTVVSYLRDFTLDLNIFMSGAIENITLGGGALNATGSAIANTLRGNASLNVLTGLAGNDTYFAGLNDQIIENSAAAAGMDTVNLDVGSSGLTVNVRIGTAPPFIPVGQLWNVENVTLLGTGNANVLVEHSTLNATQVNILIGNDGTNILDGAGGADSMTGGKGNDTYYVDNVLDKTVEIAGTGQGTDTVFSTVAWTLQAETENLNLIGVGPLAGTGNALDNFIRGSGFANTLLGLAGNDTLDGGGGNDILNGADGNDTYWVDTLGDSVLDTTGTDTVISTITGANGYNLTAAPTVENLVLFNGWAVTPAFMNGTGNLLDNRITANLSVSSINGGGGSDTLDFNIAGSLTGADTLIGGLGNDLLSNDTLLADLTGATLVLTNMSFIETAVLRAEGASGGSINFGTAGWANLREVDFTGTAGANTLTVSGAPHTGFVANALSGTPLVFGLTDYNGAGVTINGDAMGAATDVLNLAIGDSGLNTILTTSGWETIGIKLQPSADGSFAANTLDMSGLTASANGTIIEVTGSGGGQLNLTKLPAADLAGGTPFDRFLQMSLLNFTDRLGLQLGPDGGSDVIQVNVRDSSFWLDTGKTGGGANDFETIEIFALAPQLPATVNTSFVHFNELSATMGGTLSIGGLAGSNLTVDGIQATTIDNSTFSGNSLNLTAESGTGATWTGPLSGAVNFIFTAGGGADTFNFNTAGMVDGMDIVDGGAGSDIVNVNITGMGVAAAMNSGGLHFFNTETINFTNTGTAVIDASMMDGNVTMAGGPLHSTTIHGLAGSFNGGAQNGDVTIYANPFNAVGVTYNNFGTGTYTLFGSQAQGVGDTFNFGTTLDSTDYVQAFDFDNTGLTDALNATLAGAIYAPTILGVEQVTLSGTGINTFDATNVAGTYTWILSGTQTLTLDNLNHSPSSLGLLLVAASGLSGAFTVNGSDGNDSITGGSGINLMNGLEGNDSLLGGAAADTLNGGNGNDTLVGAGGADTLNGGADNDTFNITAADAAVDTVDGGAGTGDALDYSALATAVTVVLGPVGTASSTGTGIDLISNIERVIGSSVADTFTGNNTYAITQTTADYSETYQGRGGNDIIDGGGPQNGYTDLVDYNTGNNPVIVNLGLATITLTVGGQTVLAGNAEDVGSPGVTTVGIDVLTNIDGALGSSGADMLIGGSTSRGYSGNLVEFWRGNGGADIIAGNATALTSAILVGGTGIVSLLDFDTADYSRDAAGVVVNLRLGTALDGSGSTDLLFDITGVRGSDFDDILVGGNAQNDYFENFDGRKGDDHIDGGTGFDRAEYVNAAVAVNANLATGIASDGEGGTDTLVNIEALTGGDFNDTLTGSAANESFDGRGGDDIINGAGGLDRVDYLSNTTAVTVDLSIVIGQLVSAGQTDTLISIEAVRGSIYGDTLTGSGIDESFDGRAGNDIINGAGGLGDRVDYAGAHGAVNVDLFVGTTFADGDAGVDTLSNIENVRGSFYSDTIVGNALANRLEGAGSTLATFANTGVVDNDTLSGGPGNDTFVFNSALDATNNLDMINDFLSLADKIELDDAIFAIAVGTLAAGDFVLGTVAGDTTDRIIYDQPSGNLFYDADGLGGIGQVLFANLSNLGPLVAGDIVIV